MEPISTGPRGPRQTTASLVVEHLRTRIVTGDLKPGDTLNIASISSELGVSQTPAREALHLLSNEGLVELNAFRKAQVAPLSADEYEEIFIMRVGLEGLAAELGAQRISDEEIQSLKERLDELAEAAKAGDVDQFIDVDRKFHRVHYLATRRERLWERIISMRTTAERYTRLGYDLPEVGLTDTLERHRTLFEAVKNRDGARARNEIVTDLTRTYESVRAAILELEATKGSNGDGR